MGGGGGGSSGPTLQQQQLEAAQAKMNADLNLQENEQRKAILNSMTGMRVFRGSALSRAVAGNTAGGAAYGGPSPTQVRNSSGGLISRAQQSLLDAAAAGSGSTPAGGAGASGGGGIAAGGRSGASIGRAGARGVNVP